MRIEIESRVCSVWYSTRVWVRANSLTLSPQIIRYAHYIPISLKRYQLTPNTGTLFTILSPHKLTASFITPIALFVFLTIILSSFWLVVFWKFTSYASVCNALLTHTHRQTHEDRHWDTHCFQSLIPLLTVVGEMGGWNKINSNSNITHNVFLYVIWFRCTNLPITHLHTVC